MLNGDFGTSPFYWQPLSGQWSRLSVTEPPLAALSIRNDLRGEMFDPAANDHLLLVL
jgi:hypothetical protein